MVNRRSIFSKLKKCNEIVVNIGVQKRNINISKSNSKRKKKNSCSGERKQSE